MKYIIPISAILLFFSSCADNLKSDLAAFRATVKSLEQSNQTIALSNQAMYETLHERLTDPKTSEYAKIWQPKAAKISELALSVIKYIKALKDDLKHEAGYQLNGTDMLLQDDNLEPVNKIFSKKNAGAVLYNKLKEFISGINNVDERFDAEFGNKTKYVYNYLDSGKNATADFSKMFFNGVSTIRALSMLEKIENDILNTENKMVTFCCYHTVPIFDGYDRFQVIVGQSSNYVKTGDDIIITAGVGAFTTASQPKITIDGKIISVNENGVIEYKFKTPSKAGKYTKPLKMEYTRPDGSREEMTKNIEYSVIEEQ